MAKIHRLPGSVESRVEQPPSCESCAVKDVHIARLEARLNDPHWMIRRALALLSKVRGPALGLAAGAAVALMLATWPLHGLLEGWLDHPAAQSVASPPPSTLAGSADSPLMQNPAPTGAPPGGLAAPPPRRYGITPPSDGPTEIMVAITDAPGHVPHGCVMHGDPAPPCAVSK